MSALAVADLDRAPESSAVHALANLLDDLAALLLTVPTSSYVGRPLPGVSGSVGEHVRHTLDHIGALISLTPGAILTYDHRERGTPIESDPGAALRAFMRLKAALVDRLAMDPDTPVAVVSTIAPEGDAVAAWSSLAREVAFVISHTIHHQALIATLLAVQGHTVADRFGYAPSTPRSVAS
jgi:uncharacterized damage-inducible protein DinB